VVHDILEVDSGAPRVGSKRFDGSSGISATSGKCGISEVPARRPQASPSAPQVGSADHARRRVVVPAAAGSSPVAHLSRKPRISRGFAFRGGIARRDLRPKRSCDPPAALVPPPVSFRPALRRRAGPPRGGWGSATRPGRSARCEPRNCRVRARKGIGKGLSLAREATERERVPIIEGRRFSFGGSLNQHPQSRPHVAADYLDVLGKRRGRPIREFQRL
jgi:hypothetical protein